MATAANQRRSVCSSSNKKFHRHGRAIRQKTKKQTKNKTKQTNQKTAFLRAATRPSSLEPGPDDPKAIEGRPLGGGNLGAEETGASKRRDFLYWYRGTYKIATVIVT